MTSAEGEQGEERFLAYTEAYRSVFRRADQFARFRDYLRGLLDGQPGKSAEAIAARRPGDNQGLGQALQHFVSASPWDAEQLLAIYRDLLGEARRDPAGIWVVLDLAFPKKGRLSVGTQRQMARPLGKKINCQVAVAVAQVGPLGFFPLAARLYLPGTWFRRQSEEILQTIPETARQVNSRGELARELLVGLRRDLGAPSGFTGDAAYLTLPELVEWRDTERIPAVEPDAAVKQARTGFARLEAELGLADFEGRTWQGWHHHMALVLAAFGHLRARSGWTFDLNAD